MINGSKVFDSGLTGRPLATRFAAPFAPAVSSPAPGGQPTPRTRSAVTAAPPPVTSGPRSRLTGTVHDHRMAERSAWVFYAIATLGSLIGQVWVGVVVPPWPETVAWPLRAAMVVPFALVIELGGIVASAFADARQRLGESAYGWRIMSAAVVAVAVAINIIGHFDVPYLAVVFGGLGSFAYALWLMHSAARRRDALRASGKLADTAPRYGWPQWLREPSVTRLARSLAVTHGLSLHDSLSAARERIRTEARRKAIGKAVTDLIKAEHRNPLQARIAEVTYDMDRLADLVEKQADYDGWAALIGRSLVPAKAPAVRSEQPEPNPDGNAARHSRTVVKRRHKPGVRRPIAAQPADRDEMAHHQQMYSDQIKAVKAAFPNWRTEGPSRRAIEEALRQANLPGASAGTANRVRRVIEHQRAQEVST